MVRGCHSTGSISPHYRRFTDIKRVQPSADVIAGTGWGGIRWAEPKTIGKARRQVCDRVANGTDTSTTRVYGYGTDTDVGHGTASRARRDTARAGCGRARVRNSAGTRRSRPFAGGGRLKSPCGGRQEACKTARAPRRCLARGRAACTQRPTNSEPAELV